MGTINNPLPYEGYNRSPITKFNTTESDLVGIYERQIDEVVSLYGHDTLYLKLDDSSFDNIDMILGELEKHIYKDYFQIRMYVEQGVEFGINHQFAQMGFILKDEISFFIGKKMMKNIIGREPSIGDIIYYIPAKRYFKVNYVNYESIIYIGHQYVQYQLKCTEYVKNSKTSFETNNVEINRISDLENITSVKQNLPNIENIIGDERDPFGYFK